MTTPATARAGEAVTLIANAMSERELMANVIDMARRLGYLCYHTLNSRGSAAGFPDLVLVHPGDKWLPVIFAELKTERGRVRPMQQVWLDALDRESLDDGFVRVVLWRPMDWLEGRVERVLRNG